LENKKEGHTGLANTGKQLYMMPSKWSWIFAHVSIPVNILCFTAYYINSSSLLLSHSSACGNTTTRCTPGDLLQQPH
jgi:hypothetical protein